MNYPSVEKTCEQCAKANLISLDEDNFICAHCGHKNTYNNQEMKIAMVEMMKKVRKIQFKNPKNN